MDRISKETRSRIMSKIRSKNTSPELILRKAIWASGFRGYRLRSRLPGKPDIVFQSRKIAIFVDGDFWHGYLWKKKRRVPPVVYWQWKILGNISRDKKTNKLLKKEGWTVLRFWEHEVKSDIAKVIKKIKKFY